MLCSALLISTLQTPHTLSLLARPCASRLSEQASKQASHIRRLNTSKSAHVAGEQCGWLASQSVLTFFSDNHPTGVPFASASVSSSQVQSVIQASWSSVLRIHCSASTDFDDSSLLSSSTSSSSSNPRIQRATTIIDSWSQWLPQREGRARRCRSRSPVATSRSFARIKHRRLSTSFFTGHFAEESLRYHLPFRRYNKSASLRLDHYCDTTPRIRRAGDRWHWRIRTRIPTAIQQRHNIDPLPGRNKTDQVPRTH